MLTDLSPQGQTFIALDPGNFAPNFPERMETFMQEMRQLPPVSHAQLDYERTNTLLYHAD